MALIKTKKELEIIREAGWRLAKVMERLIALIRPGLTGGELDAVSEEMIRAGGDFPAFLGYTPRGAFKPFPGTLCFSINDEIVHGIPNEKRKVLNEGDIVSLDLGLKHNGFFADMARTVGVGRIDEGAKRLINITKGALDAGISAAKRGKYIGDIGSAVENYARSRGYRGVVEELGGHGVGASLHEEPVISNVRSPQRGPKISAGMVLAIEPMINEGSRHIALCEDGYTYRTKDGKRSAHFEDTIIILDNGLQEIITRT